MTTLRIAPPSLLYLKRLPVASGVYASWHASSQPRAKCPCLIGAPCFLLQSPKARRAGQPGNGRLGGSGGSGAVELAAIVVSRDEAVVLDGGRQPNGSMERKPAANGRWL